MHPARFLYLLLLLLPACGTTEMRMSLATQTFKQDFGTAMGTLPAFSCPPVPCELLPVPDTRVTVFCDTTRAECAGRLKVRVRYIVDFSLDAVFRSGFAQGLSDKIRDIDLSYGLTNSMSFDVAEVRVYLGAGNVLTETADGVVAAGVIGPFRKRTDIADGAGHLLVPDGSPAHAFLIEQVRHPERTFSVFLAATVHLKAGDEFPSGAMELRLTPVLTLLNR